MQASGPIAQRDHLRTCWVMTPNVGEVKLVSGLCNQGMV